nr:uncharacterized protein LOC113828437 [Penaeus vannamei]
MFSVTPVKLHRSVKIESVEYPAVTRFLYMNGRTPHETFHEMKVTDGEEASSYDAVQHRHRQSRCGRRSVQAHPTPTAIQVYIRQVETAVLKHRRINVYQLAQDVKIVVSGDKIMHDYLHIEKMSARRVPRLLTPFQKQEVHCFKAL